MGVRVCLVNFTSGGVSGSGRHVSLLARGLAGEGVTVKVVDASSAWHLDFPMLRAPSFTLGAAFRIFDVDVVHIHNPKLVLAGLLRASRCVVTLHGGMFEFSLKYGSLGRGFISTVKPVLRGVGRVTSVMKWEAERNGWTWVPNMLDLEAVARIKPADESVVLFVGRDDSVKNYGLFRSVVKLLGVPYKAFGVEEVVSWERVISYMKSAECLMITSVWEGMPSVLLEAWASRCPVIAPSIPAFTPFSEALILADHQTGSYIEAYRMLPSVRDTITDRGYEIVKGLDYRLVTRQYLRIYRELLTQS